jgi:CheY-like chemotaxis protein
METIGHLTGGVAHDFNNLLTIILGNLESMNRQITEDGVDPSRIKRLAENASRGAQRAAALTQRLLAFARRQPLDPRPVDVNKLLTGMSDLLHRTLGEQIAIQPVLAGGLWRTHADPNQLEVAVLNLAVNARDAMPEGGKLTIETSNAYLDEDYSSRQAEVMPGQYVAIAITDTGIGMTKEIAARAFEPFFTTKDTGHGTGLGLSQVYGFVKQSGGHAKIYSEYGEGTTVRIYLPRLLGEEAEAELDAAVATVPRGSNAETILVVEDDEDVRAHSAGTLQELGYRILEAGNGKAAQDMLDRHPEIALLFTDVGLPGGMNGRQLADAARARRPNLKVLFTTGYAKNAIVHEGRLDPGIQLVTKPFVYATLASKVRDLLDANRQPAGILVVKDEVLVRMVAVDSLDALGFRSFEAGSAREALDRMRTPGNQIDAVIIDIGLPDRKGDALALELRGMRKDLPIIIASGYAGPALMERFAADRLVGFLRKPYGVDELAQALSAMNLRPPKL